MDDAFKTYACYALCIIAGWLIVRHVREIWIAWYNGVDLKLSMTVRVSIGLQILVNLTAIVLALIVA